MREKVLFEPMQLSVDQIVDLVDQTQCDVCDHLCGTRSNELSIKFETLGFPAAKFSDVLRLPRRFFPNAQITGAKVIEIIVQEFFKTRSSNIRQF